MAGNDRNPSPSGKGDTTTIPKNGLPSKTSVPPKTPAPSRAPDATKAPSPPKAPTAPPAPPKAPAAPPAPAPPRAPPAPRAPTAANTEAGSSTSASRATADPSKLPAPPVDANAKEPSRALTKAAAKAVAHAFGSMSYSIVGGGACSILGGPRQTGDIDAVVCKGQTTEARRRIAALPSQFSVDPRTRHTNFLSTPAVEVEILTPPTLFKEAFDENTPTITVDGVRVLKPTLLLNSKCGSIMGRANEQKKSTDAQDIVFLLLYCAKRNMWPNATECPNANKAFVDYFVAQYGQRGWAEAGWDFVQGRWTH